MTSTTPNSTPTFHNMPTKLMGGIVAGVVVFLVLFAAMLFYLLWYYRRSEEKPNPSDKVQDTEIGTANPQRVDATIEQEQGQTRSSPQKLQKKHNKSSKRMDDVEDFLASGRTKITSLHPRDQHLSEDTIALNQPPFESLEPNSFNHTLKLPFHHSKRTPEHTLSAVPPPAIPLPAIPMPTYHHHRQLIPPTTSVLNRTDTYNTHSPHQPLQQHTVPNGYTEPAPQANKYRHTRNSDELHFTAPNPTPTPATIPTPSSPAKDDSTPEDDSPTWTLYRPPTPPNARHAIHNNNLHIPTPIPTSSNPPLPPTSPSPIIVIQAPTPPDSNSMYSPTPSSTAVPSRSASAASNASRASNFSAGSVEELERGEARQVEIRAVQRGSMGGFVDVELGGGEVVEKEERKNGSETMMFRVVDVLKRSTSLYGKRAGSEKK